MSSIFSKIIEGSIHAHVVAETNDYLAFLDISPRSKGHTLCIPKKETDYIFDLSDSEYLGLMIFSKRVARAMQKTVPCKRIGISVIGLEVPHAHVHLIPINEIGDMNFEKEAYSIDTLELADLAKRIRKNLM